jgi:mono/diheme cytochrome c family protein
MSAEFVPENVLRAFIATYPELFPSGDLAAFGLIPDREFGWPIGISRAAPKHLGGLPALGVNCAACHVGEVERRSLSAGSPEPDRVRVLGMTSHFDAEALYGAVIASTFKSRDPGNMKRLLGAYLDASDPEPDATKRDERRQRFETAWELGAVAIETAIHLDPGGMNGVAPGELQALNPRDLELTGKRLDEVIDLAALATSMLKLFHNMRAALHLPDSAPAQTPPASGPGRNDAFGLLSAVLFHAPQPPAPVKYGLVWNLAKRTWVHWDGNTRSPIGRNLLASLGLGAPLIGRHGELDYALVARQTAISENILPPQYPFEIDRPAAELGAKLYATNCASCHDGGDTDQRLHQIAEIGTDPMRARLFNETQAGRFNGFLMTLETPGYAPPKTEAIRSTQKYWAPDLAGVWARSPYLHNGSVRTMAELLTKPAARATTFHRGSKSFDTTALGYADEGRTSSTRSTRATPTPAMTTARR